MVTDKKTRKLSGIQEVAEALDKEIPNTVSYDSYRQLEVRLEKALQEVETLKQMLSKVNIADFALPVSDEEEIASVQIARIKQASRERPITLEESKILDSLVKIKRLSKEDATEIISSKDLPKNLDKSQLIQIAAVKNGKN